MNFTLHVWRQQNPQDKGEMKTYPATNVNADMSFLEMLDVVNEQLQSAGKQPVAFDHDCREGICGMCGVVINGQPHGPLPNTTTCQLHMRHFNDNDEITIEPWRATGFPVLKDLVVDRSAFDRILAAGGFVSISTGSAPEANSIPVARPLAEEAMDNAACIGCGACVAACPNASAMLFTAAKVSQLALMPQGRPERESRVENMVAQMEKEGFGNCTNIDACSKECPKQIGQVHIARLNREYIRAKITAQPQAAAQPPAALKAEKTGQIRAGGIDYHYAVYGQGEPLLLLHGGLRDVG